MVAIALMCLAGLPLKAEAEDRSTYVLASLPAQLNPASLPTPRSRQQPAPRTLVDQLASTYTSPEAVARFLQQDFTFTQDEELFGQEDYWQSPEEFVSRRRGDCEDYALLAQALLTRNGIRAYVVSLFGEDGYAHTVSVFLDGQGRYNAINQGTLRYYHAPSLEALASAINPSWTFGGIVEQDGTRARFVTELVNPDPVPAALDEIGPAF